MTFWNLENIDFKSIRYLFITEGIFKSVKIKNLGHPTVATLSNDPSPSAKTQIKLWSNLGIKTIGIGDNDKAGNKLKNSVNYFYTVPDPYKDIDEMDDNSAKEFLNNILRLNGIL